MTVSTSYAPLTFNGDDATTAFAVTWPFFDSSLVVTLVDSTGVETVKTITTHYTVSGGTDSDGLPATGTVTMLTAPASGETLRITRNTSKVQSSSWTNGGAYQAKTLEATLDKIILIAQETQAGINDDITGDVMQLNTSGATDYWDAEDQIILNVGTSTTSDAAVTYQQLSDAVLAAGSWLGTTGATDNALLRANGTGGATIQSSGVIVDDDDNVSGVKTLGLQDSDDSHVVKFSASSNVTADRTVSVVTGDANRELDLTALVRPVATRTALKALDTTQYTTAFLKEAGREGVFEWDGSNLSTEVAADTQEGVYVSSGDGSSGAWVRSYDGDVQAKWFGVTGDGSTDNATTLQAAVDYVESLGGGVLYFDAGIYMLSAEILIQQPVTILCAGFGEDGNSAAGDATRLVTFRRTAGGNAAPIFRFQSATDTQIIRGGGVLGAMLDGNDVATIGIHGRSVQYAKYDIATWSLVNSGIRLDDGNNATSGFCDIWLHFVYGSGATPANAHGIHFRGEDGTGGCTRNLVVRVNGLHDDGHMIFFDGNTDNNKILACNAARQSGATGYGIYLGAGAVSHARSNAIFNLAGTVYAEDNTYGNVFHRWTSELSGLTLESTAAHVEVRSLSDYAIGKSYATPQYDLRQEIGISSFAPLTNYGTIGTVWAAVRLDDATTETVYANVPRDIRRPAGTITGIRITFVMASANSSANVVLRFRLETATASSSVAVADTNEAFTVAVNDTAGVLNEAEVTLSTPLTLAEGDTILFRMDREGGDASDTATGDLGILTATLLFEADGPANGTGPWNIPIMSA